VRKIEKEELAIELFEKGAIQFGEFRLKMHEKHPDAPLSPIFINLRKKPKGPLDQETIEIIGKALFEKACEAELDFDHIVGLPKAGEPLAKAFVKASGWDFSILFLEKEEKADHRRRILPIVHGNYNPGDVVLVIDDVITKADTKIEGILALKANSLKVKDCLVVVDREQSGRTQLSSIGVRLHALFTMSEILEIYVRRGYISEKVRNKVINYQKEVEEYLAAHQNL